MTEEWLRRELADAVEDEPPLWLGIDEVVTAGQRRVARRRTLLGAAAATAALTVLATAASLLVTPAGESQPTGSSPSSRQGTASPGPWPGPLAEPSELTREDYQALVGPLRARVAAAAAEHLTGGSPTVMSRNEDRFRPGAGIQSWQFTIELEGDSDASRVTVQIGATHPGPEPYPCPTPDPGDLIHSCGPVNTTTIGGAYMGDDMESVAYLWTIAPTPAYRTITVSMARTVWAPQHAFDQLEPFSRDIVS